MPSWVVILPLSAIVPLTVAVWANRLSALSHAVVWAALAWLGWTAAAYFDSVAARYLAVCLTACAGVAVLGARRPGVAMWNGVVAGLLLTLLIPLAQQVLTDSSWIQQPVWRAFVGIALTVGLLNFLPTRLGLGAATLLAGSLITQVVLETASVGQKWWAIGLVSAAPWLGWLGLLAERGRSDWSRFRDRFGFVWAQRVQEQFQHASMHAGRDVVLTWSGVRTLDGGEPTVDDVAASDELLAALLKRFTEPQ